MVLPDLAMGFIQLYWPVAGVIGTAKILNEASTMYAEWRAGWKAQP